MDKHQLQQELPEGLKLEKELVGAVVFGSAFEAADTRFDEKDPIRRVVHFLETDGGEAWKDSWKPQLIERIRRLAETPLHRVVRPLEVGNVANGSVLYVVDDRYASNLSAHVSREGMDSPVAARLFGQIVDGLVSLHGRDMAHGDLRLKNICVDEAVAGLETNCQIGNSAIGPLLYWSGGTLVDDDAPAYYLPEWKGCPRKSSIKADLYALGLIGCELFLGQGAVRERSQSKEGESLLQNQLKQRHVPSRIRRVLGSLLNPDPNKRPGTAAEVRKQLDHDAAQPWIAVGIVASMLIMLGLMVVGWREAVEAQDKIIVVQTENESLTATVDNRDDELQETERDLETAKRRADSAKQDAATLESGNKRLKAAMAKLTDDRKKISAVLSTAATDSKKVKEEVRQILSGTKSQRIWGEFVKKVRPTSKPSQSPQDVIAELKRRIKSNPPSGEDASQLTKWLQRVDVTWKDISPAYTKNNDVVTSWNNHLERPWEDSTRTVLEQALAKAVWDGLRGANKKPEEIVKAATEQAAAKKTPDWLRRLLTGWIKAVQGLTKAGKARAWLDAETTDKVVGDYRELVRKAVGAPWDSAAYSKAAAELEALNEAADIWEKYAKLSADSWSVFVSKTLGAARSKKHPARVETILRDWQAAFFSHTGTWKLQLVKGSVKPGKAGNLGTDRLLTVYVKEDEAASLKHKWTRNNLHNYSTEGTKRDLVTFKWKVGQSVGLFLEDQGRYWRARNNLIYGKTGYTYHDPVKFAGPVAIWRLHVKGEVSTAATGVSLSFRVVDCPGPPKEYYDALTAAQKAKELAKNILNKGTKK